MALRQEGPAHGERHLPDDQGPGQRGRASRSSPPSATAYVLARLAGDMYRIYDYFQGDERREREVQIGLGERADRVLAAHNELYIAGTRLGL